MGLKIIEATALSRRTAGVELHIGPHVVRILPALGGFKVSLIRDRYDAGGNTVLLDSVDAGTLADRLGAMLDGE